MRDEPFDGLLHGASASQQCLPLRVAEVQCARFEN